jgi:hypothetical protein
MAAKTWEADFRYPAICRSIKRLESEAVDDLWDSSSSYCVPVAKKPVVGWTPGKISVAFLVLGFVLLGSSVLLLGMAERRGKQGNPMAQWVQPLAACLGVSGIACFFVPLLLDRYIMKWLIGARGAELLRQRGELLCAEISHTDRSKMTVSIDGDDYVLILADVLNRRLLIEGVAARYMIRAQDVLQLEDFEFLNYVGAELSYRIDDEVILSIAIARVSILLELIRQLPILFFLRRMVRNRILRVCKETLAIRDVV